MRQSEVGLHFFAGEWLDVLRLPMTVTARMASVVSSTLPARRRLIRSVRQKLQTTEI